MNKKFLIVGGDLRIVKLAEILSEEGNDVITYALEKADSLIGREKIEIGPTLKEGIEQADIIVSSIPFSSNKEDVNTPFSDISLSIDELFSGCKGKTLIVGSINGKIMEKAKEYGVNLIDILSREELTILNTISTAEGAIQIAMEETLKTIHGSNILITGFGRIGKMLSKMLTGIGANVSCEARKVEDLAWAKAFGYEAIALNTLDEYLYKYDIIINTIPAVILDENKLKLLKKDCLVIDVASKPGGVDEEAAKKLGIKTVWALSLPGKVAPQTSAEYIKDTIFNVINENKTEAGAS